MKKGIIMFFQIKNKTDTKTYRIPKFVYDKCSFSKLLELFWNNCNVLNQNSAFYFPKD